MNSFITLHFALLKRDHENTELGNFTIKKNLNIELKDSTSQSI